MKADRCSGPSVVRVSLVIFLLAVLTSVTYSIQPSDNARTIEVPGMPAEIHNKDQGWGELPSLAVTADYAYVAYDVREGYESHVYLARIQRNSRGETVKLRLDNGVIEYGPSITVDDGGVVWVAWTSYRNGEWFVRASLVSDMKPSPEIVLSGPPGFSSQVVSASRDGITWFAWVVWEDGGYRIMTSRGAEWPIGLGIFYESLNPVARPDICVLSRDHVIVAWDEYMDGRFVVKMREWIDGTPREVVDLSGSAYANSWEPHVVGSEKHALVVWHRVPADTDRCQPAAAVPGAITLEQGIDQPSDRETWRVACFLDGEGNTWIAWLTRVMYRNTRFYLRRIDDDGISETYKVDLPGPRYFMNWFDPEWNGNLIMAWEYSGGIYLSEFGLPDPGKTGMPVVAEESGTDAAVAPGAPEDLPYSTVYDGEDLHVYFGDYHNHTSFSDGRAYPDMAMILARDIRGLDFTCITDHDITITPGEFAWNNAVADILTQSGDYACLHGYEPSKGWAQEGFGHWNLLFPKGGSVFQFEEGMTPAALFAYVRQQDAILIPHHVGKKFAPYDWDYFDEIAQPVVEMCSVHGIFETYFGHEGEADMVEGKFVEDGLERGYHFGFVGGSDSHNCFELFGAEYGLTGLYAASLTPDRIYEAMRKRRTFALTGSRIVIDFRCNGRFMGEEIEGAEKLSFTGYVASPDSVVTAAIISGGETVFKTAAAGLEVSLDWNAPAPNSETYYYLRAATAKGDLAWSSPIWIRPAK